MISIDMNLLELLYLAYHSEPIAVLSRHRLECRVSEGVWSNEPELLSLLVHRRRQD